MIIRQDEYPDRTCEIWQPDDPRESASTEELPLLCPSECRAVVLREGRRLLDNHGLYDWEVEIHQKARGWLGQCDRFQRSIGVAQHFVDAKPTFDIVQDLLLHEIAHTLTKGGHNFEWKRKYAELLASHFDAEKVAEFLDNDRYCRKYMDRLLGEVNITQPSSVA